MKEKKKKEFGGIEIKYEKELASLSLSSFALSQAAAIVVDEMHRDDFDHGDIQSGWLNSPYQLLQKVERDIEELENKIKDDPAFSDSYKRKFFTDFIEPIKEGNRNAREIDAYIMSGIIPPDLDK